MKKTILLTTALLLAMSLVLAAQPFPHYFEGKIISYDSSSSNAKTLTAVIDGAVTASTEIVGDSYELIVIDNVGYGGAIEFFIGNEKAYESYTFKKFEDTTTNLTFNTIPDEVFGDCGDGICAVEECSFCAIDCSVSQCLNNNVCDSAIGEDQVTAPSDCVTAPTTTPTTTPGGNTKSSSSSSNSNSNSESTTSSESNASNESPITYTSGISIETLNEEENVTVEEVGRNKITGNAIRVLTTTGSKVTGFIILILAILIIIYIRRKNKNKEPTKTPEPTVEQPVKKNTKKKKNNKKQFKKKQFYKKK